MVAFSFEEKSRRFERKKIEVSGIPNNSEAIEVVKSASPSTIECEHLHNNNNNNNNQREKDKEEKEERQTKEEMKKRNDCASAKECIASCKGYGRICPWYAQRAAVAAEKAVEKLWKDSKVFNQRDQQKKKKTKVAMLKKDDLILGEKIGEGGFSVVRKVTLKQQQQTPSSSSTPKPELAVKYLKKQIMVDSKTFELGAADLVTEANFLQHLQHSHIIQLYGITAGNPSDNIKIGQESSFFLVIERLNETLEQRIHHWQEERCKVYRHSNLLSRQTTEYKDSRRAALYARMAIAKDILPALEHMHSHNIVYRDLKPDNVGLDTRGNVKLFDFGLAKELKRCLKTDRDGMYKLTGNTGSRRYMAPEVAKDEPYGLSVDIYSFGILLWEVASLEKSFAGFNANRHMLQVVMGNQRPRFDSANTVWFPIECQQLMARCWHKDPFIRPSLQEVANDLDNIIYQGGDMAANASNADNLVRGGSGGSLNGNKRPKSPPLKVTRSKTTGTLSPQGKSHSPITTQKKTPKLAPPPGGFGSMRPGKKAFTPSPVRKTMSLTPMEAPKSFAAMNPVKSKSMTPKGVRAKSWGIFRSKS